MSAAIFKKKTKLNLVYAWRAKITWAKEEKTRLSTAI